VEAPGDVTPGVRKLKTLEQTTPITISSTNRSPKANEYVSKSPFALVPTSDTSPIGGILSKKKASASTKYQYY
jgi:hypothetical protein